MTASLDLLREGERNRMMSGPHGSDEEGGRCHTVGGTMGGSRETVRESRNPLEVWIQVCKGLGENGMKSNRASAWRGETNTSVVLTAHHGLRGRGRGSLKGRASYF